ncbi:hypothetical protein GCM10023320_79770 [Pseudonocardia adelaidensis]|uniref:Uncharacterized protein n=1 Tax=Pseudonocardia adelaidensis TaxID=648754 RepID=A0ABP9P5J6_9PSEU
MLADQPDWRRASAHTFHRKAFSHGILIFEYRTDLVVMPRKCAVRIRAAYKRWIDRSAGDLVHYRAVAIPGDVGASYTTRGWRRNCRFVV